MKRLAFFFGALLTASVAQSAEIPTSGKGHVQNPVWSPDGAWLAYEVNNLSNSVDLWLVKVDGGMGTQPRQLRIPGASRGFGAGGTVVAAPAWTSKPQTMLFFEGSNAGGLLRIYYAMPGSASPNEFIDSNTQAGNLSSPTMAADGTRFAFAGDSRGKGDIMMIDFAAGSTVTEVANTSASENFPAFAPSGKAVSFSRKGNGEDLFYWSDSGQENTISKAAGDQTRPRFVSDSEVVFFTSERGEGRWDVAVAPVSGGRSRIVTRDVRLPARAAPALTPDGKHVVVVSANPAEGDKIRIVSLENGSSQEIATGLVACGEPSVVTSGGRSWLAFTALPSAGADWRGLHVLDITGKY